MTITESWPAAQLATMNLMHFAIHNKLVFSCTCCLGRGGLKFAS